MKNLKIIILSLFFYFHLVGISSAINYYKYPSKSFDANICKLIYDELDFPHPNYDSEDPTSVRVDFYVD